ncbi:hypothetical protein B0H10DRAFT_2085240 [Mycena sp. CBHHK59/15]|nr:hypothetical protein B0H10DRAFT_2085240 [Mycena sp. CBHHK59/15]
MFSMSWKTVWGEDCHEELFLGPKYAKLADFMRNIAQAGGHTTRTVFGPNASYFSISPSGFSWQNLPPVLEQDIMGRMKKGVPTNVALGMHGAFVVLYSDGNVTFDVATHYPAVDAMVRNSGENAQRKGIAFIALSPYAAGQYYVAYGDGSASWNLPNEWSEDVTTLAPRASDPRYPSLGLGAAAGGTPSAFGVPGSPLGSFGQTPSPSSGSSTASMAAHRLGKLWNAYQQQQQSGSSSPFAGQTTSFDPSSVMSSFDPSSVPAFDPTTLVAGLDPNSVLSGMGALFDTS